MKKLRSKRKFYKQIALATGHGRVTLINNYSSDFYKLGAHAELPNHDFPLCEGRPYGLKSFTQLCSARPSLRNEISSISKGNLTIDEGSGGKKMGREQTRTKAEVVKEIKELAKKDRQLLSHKYLRKKGYADIVYDAYKYFGTWNKAILASGEKPLYNKWDKEKIIKEIKRLYKELGKAPNYGELRRNGNRALPQAARIYWGSWVNAMRAAGLKPHRNDYWTKEELIAELKREVGELGYVPSGKELKRKGRCDLVSSGAEFFGRYNNYLIAAGFEPILLPNIWTKESVKNELRSLAKELKRTPTERDVIALGRRTLISAAWRQFKGWNSAIEAAGLNANWNFVKDKTWKIWEKFVLELCGSLFPDSETHKILPNKTMPDFYEYTTRTIIEVKINGSDTTIPATVRNYSPYCNRIEIWYLTGKPAKTAVSKVIFRGPEYVRDIIKEDKELLKQFIAMSNHYTQNGREKN